MRTFTYDFEELPLAIVNGVEAGLVNGQAVIGYGGGYWTIEQITLEGFGERVNGRREWPQVACPDAIATIIEQRLEGEWSGRVDTAVSEQLQIDREDAAEMRAEMRRDALMGL